MDGILITLMFPPLSVMFLSWLITAQEHYDDGFRQNQRYQRQKVSM